MVSQEDKKIAITVSDYDDEKNRLEEMEQMAGTSKDDPMIELRSFAPRPTSAAESGIGSNSSTVNNGNAKLEIIAPNRTVSLSALDIANESTPTSDNSKNVNQFLVIPPSGSFTNLSPGPIRRAISVRSLGDLNSLSPSFSRPIRPQVSAGYQSMDSISVINIPIENTDMTQQEKTQILKRNLSKFLSSVYAVFIITFGAVIYIGDQDEYQKFISDIFSSVIAAVGTIWLIILHADLYNYKREVLQQLKKREDAMQEQLDRYSNATEYIFNSGFDFVTENESTEGTIPKTPPYRFLQGRHSGSFYLKIGMAAFCFGYLIHQGLQLGQHILNFIDDEKKALNCSKPSSIILHIILPIHAFYQLFITFKYSNIVINRNKAMSRFGLMHLIATCVCFWFSTIVEEAVEDYNHRSFNGTGNTTDMEFDIASFHITVRKRSIWPNAYQCQKANSILSTRSLSAIPYLYPFAIEYNIILAGVWYIVWQNIGQEHHPSDPHHLRHTISQDETGGGEIAYQSNLVINADCHASNKGLFIGLFVLLASVVTVIVFFVAMTTEGFQGRAVSIHTGQEGILTFLGFISVIVSMVQINKLNINRHPITFLDDVLLFVPLPFYFLHGIMSIIAEYSYENYVRLAVDILVTFQVIMQTAFIINGLRRCSNTQALRFKKLGREIITFLIILNITLWIVNTFELKSVESYHAQEEYFGDFVWMFIGHTTLPLMLFYRFHSSVCLSDIWKSAYEKES